MLKMKNFGFWKHKGEDLTNNLGIDYQSVKGDAPVGLRSKLRLLSISVNERAARVKHFIQQLVKAKLEGRMGVIKPLVNNRYFLTGLIFFIWMLFFDQSNIINRVRLSNQIGNMEEQKELYKQTIIDNRELIEELRGNRDNLEKFAREQFLMKRSDEEIFIIVE